MILIFFWSTYSIFSITNTCSFITNKFLQKSERGEVGKPRSRIFFFHYAELMSTLDLLSAYPESFMWSAFHMVGKSPAASGNFFSILSSHPTHHQYHLGARGHSASLTSIKDSNISIGTNTQKNYTATWPRTMQQGYTCWTLDVGTSQWEYLSLIFLDRVIKLSQISIAFQKTVPGLLQTNRFLRLDSEIF